MNAAYHTTAAERSPRIGTLVHDAEREDVQALLEIAITALEEGIGEAISIPHGASSLAAQIAATFRPGDEPAFAVGAEVKNKPESDDAESVSLGKVTSRYLNESGDWEYQVHHPRYGTVAYAEGWLV